MISRDFRGGSCFLFLSTGIQGKQINSIFHQWALYRDSIRSESNVPGRSGTTIMGFWWWVTVVQRQKAAEDGTIRRVCEKGHLFVLDELILIDIDIKVLAQCLFMMMIDWIQRSQRNNVSVHRLISLICSGTISEPNLIPQEQTEQGWRGFPYRLCYYPAKAIKDEDVVSHTEWEFYGKDPVVDYCAFLTPYENLIKVMEYARDKWNFVDEVSEKAKIIWLRLVYKE